MVPISVELGAHFVEVADNPYTGPRSDRHEAVTRALALAHEHRLARVVDIGHAQVREFRTSDRTRVEDLENRAIAKSKCRRGVGTREHGFDLFDTEDGLGHAVLSLG